MDKSDNIMYPGGTPLSAVAAEDQPQGCCAPLHDSYVPPAEVILSEPAPPSAPAYMLAHAFEENKVTLLWGQAQGADGYLILRGESQSNLKPVAAVEDPSYIDTQPQAGKTYYYAVRAYNEQGQSAATAVAAVIIPAVQKETATQSEEAAPFTGKRLRLQKKLVKKQAEAEDTPAESHLIPPAPMDLCTKIRGTHLVELTWHGKQREGMEYRLYRSATPWCCYGLIAETKQCTYLDTVPEAGTKYYYFVQAVWEGRSSQASAMAEALTYPPLPPPEPPEHLRVSAVNLDAIELRWSHARGAAAYVVYARMEGEEFQIIGHTLNGGYLHENLPADINIDYRILSYHDTGVSEPSAICSARTGAQRTPSRPAAAARPAPPLQNNRRFPTFSLQSLQMGNRQQ